MKFHSCIEAHIEDCSDITVDIQQPCCCNPVNVYAVNYPCSIGITSIDGSCTIRNASAAMEVNLQPNASAVITMEWVCGTNFSERYLCGSDSELITIDGNYLVVKYKPEK